MPYDRSQPSYIAMGWALIGSPKLKNAKYPNLRSFAKFEGKIDVQYARELRDVAVEYGPVVAEAFNRAHGRTGSTAETLGYWTTNTGGGDGVLPTRVISVRFQGGIGYVVNPIRTHQIIAHNALTLSNWYTAPYRGETPRSRNFYSEFPDGSGAPGAAPHLASVEWFQGGEESFSPDRSWFESGAAKQVLETESVAALGRLAQFAKVLWSEEFSGYVVIESGKEKIISF